MKTNYSTLKISSSNKPKFYIIPKSKYKVLNNFLHLNNNKKILLNHNNDNPDDKSKNNFASINSFRQNNQYFQKILPNYRYTMRNTHLNPARATYTNGQFNRVYKNNFRNLFSKEQTYLDSLKRKKNIRRVKNQGMETKVECFNPSDLDFRFVIQKYQAQGFNHFYIQFWPPQSNILLRQLSENNVAPNHIFGSGIDTDTDTSLYNDINHFGGNSGTPEFINRLMEEYNLKNVYMAASAYDLISLAIDAFENVEDVNNIDEILAYIRANATRKCMSGDCKLLDNGFIANKAEWRTYKDGKPVFLGD